MEFVAKLKALNPAMVVTQPVFGSPTSVPAANRLLEGAFNTSSGKALGSVAKVGVMIYSGTGSEEWVQYYTQGCSKHCTQWNCPLAACVPSADMVLGIDGSAAAGPIASISSDVKSMGLGGVMVWYASLLDPATGKNGLVYGSMDASINKLGAWEEGMRVMQA